MIGKNVFRKPAWESSWCREGEEIVKLHTKQWGHVKYITLYVSSKKTVSFQLTLMELPKSFYWNETVKTIVSASKYGLTKGAASWDEKFKSLTPFDKENSAKFGRFWSDLVLK